jgi:hypothetical protein
VHALRLVEALTVACLSATCPHSNSSTRRAEQRQVSNEQQQLSWGYKELKLAPHAL